MLRPAGLALINPSSRRVAQLPRACAQVACLGGAGAKLARAGASSACCWSPAAPDLSARIVVAALNEAGRADVVVSDVLGDDGKWRNLAKRQVADVVPPAELMRWLAGRKLDARDPSGRDLRHHRDRRRPGDGDQLPLLAASARLVHGDAARRSSMPRRPRPMATARRALPTTGRWRRCKQLRPMNLYGWSKHLFDMAVAERVAQRRKAAAAMGRPEVLQRVRPERVPQGRDDERAGQALRRRQGGRRCGCSSRTATASPTATSGATSSMSTTWCGGDVAARDAYGVGLFNVGTGKARSFRDLMHGDLSPRSARSRRSNTSTCRSRSAAAISISRRAQVDRLLARRLQWRLHPAGRCRRTLRHGLPRHRRPLSAERRDDQCSISMPLSDASHGRRCSASAI